MSFPSTWTNEQIREAADRRARDAGYRVRSVLRVSLCRDLAVCVYEAEDGFRFQQDVHASAVLRASGGAP